MVVVSDHQMKSKDENSESDKWMTIVGSRRSVMSDFKGRHQFLPILWLLLTLAAVAADSSSFLLVLETENNRTNRGRRRRQTRVSTKWGVCLCGYRNIWMILPCPRKLHCVIHVHPITLNWTGSLLHLTNSLNYKWPGLKFDQDARLTLACVWHDSVAIILHGQ